MTDRKQTAARRLTVDLSNLPAVSNTVFYPLFEDRHRFLVLVGGAASGKSVFAARKVLTRCITEPGSRQVIFRKVLRTIRQSAWAEVLNLIYREEWQAHFHINTSEMTMTFVPTGAQILCVGLDDWQKVKSIQGVTSAWIEEATELTEADVNAINLYVRGQTRTYHQIILTFNPISARHWLRARFCEAEDDRVRVVRTTQADNRFLDADYRREIEALKDRDYQLYRIYGLGEWGLLEGQIYALPMLDTWPEMFDETIYGLDFGFNNPCALVEENLRDGEAYEREMLYQTHLTTNDLILRMKDLALVLHARIYADAAEPDRIVALAEAGFNVFPCAKGQGSVNAGIAFVKGLRIHGRADNANLNAEVEAYVWAKDRNGTPLDEPVKFNDHAMDARRYALFTHLKEAVGSWDDVRVVGQTLKTAEAFHDRDRQPLTSVRVALKDY